MVDVGVLEQRLLLVIVPEQEKCQVLGLFLLCCLHKPPLLLLLHPLHVVLRHGVLPGARGRVEEQRHRPPGIGSDIKKWPSQDSVYSQNLPIDEHQLGVGQVSPRPGPHLYIHLVTVKSHISPVSVNRRTIAVNEPTSTLSSTLMACSMALSLEPALLPAHPILKNISCDTEVKVNNVGTTGCWY